MKKASQTQAPPEVGSSDRVRLSKGTFRDVMQYIKDRNHAGSWWNDARTYSLVRKIEGEMEANDQALPTTATTPNDTTP